MLIVVICPTPRMMQNVFSVPVSLTTLRAFHDQKMQQVFIWRIWLASRFCHGLLNCRNMTRVGIHQHRNLKLGKKHKIAKLVLLEIILALKVEGLRQTILDLRNAASIILG
ncbi:hypothetical protein DBR44_13115 [Aquitalea sp. FJL05]|nr:hypothetical protein DBR44_13115 [Aquitalea sp. FJL05]